MAEKFSLKDHLFNPQTVGQLAREYEAGVPGFDGAKFSRQALSGFAERELLQRLDWLADCIQDQLAPDFPTLAKQLLSAMPPQLDPAKTDDDFGQFIHAVPGILAVRHGLEDHRDLALDLLHEATQRFSMEFYIRPFLNQWPDQTLARLHRWAGDENYHVRRLVSEGTRPKLPWAKNVTLTQEQTLPLLDMLHADGTRYVTRSVSNHLNDISKTDPEAVLQRLKNWGETGQQTDKELEWMKRHALRTLIKQGHSGAMTVLGYRDDVEVAASMSLSSAQTAIGETMSIEVELITEHAEPLLIDYVLWTTKADGQLAPKVFKMKIAETKPGKPLKVKKNHRFKGDATTFTLRAGPAKIGLQVNGRIIAESSFELMDA